MLCGLCYMGVKRLNDIQMVKVDDVTFMETGNVGVYKSKTDRECLGVEI